MEPERMAKKEFTVVFQGDSITDTSRYRDCQDSPNVPQQLGCGYAALVAAGMLGDFPKKDYRFFNRGISGNRVVDLYARWKTDCLNLNPDLLSILIGVNDTWHERNYANGVEPERYEQVYRMLLDWTISVRPKLKLLLLEPFVFPIGSAATDWVPEIRERASIVKKLAGEFGARFVPLQGAFDVAAKKTTQAYWLPDGVHPSPAGHHLIARAWRDAASELL